MDLTLAARRYLVDHTPLNTVVGASNTFAHWVFRDRLYVSVEGTGQVAVVLAERGGWAAPNPHNTMRFPVLQVEVYADPDRAADLNPVTPAYGAESKARAVFNAVDPYLHWVGRVNEQYWGGTNTEQPLRVLGCTRAAEPSVDDVPDGDGLIRLLARYNIVLG